MHLDLLKLYLKQIEETQLLELLEINSEELVDMFEERIIKKKKYLEGEVEALPEPPEAGDGGTFYDDEDLFDPDLNGE